MAGKAELTERIGGRGRRSGTPAGCSASCRRRAAGFTEDGDTVALRGFSTSRMSERAARKGRNRRTGEEIEIAASRSLAFKASK